MTKNGSSFQEKNRVTSSVTAPAGDTNPSDATFLKPKPHAYYLYRSSYMRKNFRLVSQIVVIGICCHLYVSCMQ